MITSTGIERTQDVVAMCSPLLFAGRIASLNGLNLAFSGHLGEESGVEKIVEAFQGALINKGEIVNLLTHREWKALDKTMYRHGICYRIWQCVLRCLSCICCKVKSDAQIAKGAMEKLAYSGIELHIKEALKGVVVGTDLAPAISSFRKTLIALLKPVIDGQHKMLKVLYASGDVRKALDVFDEAVNNGELDHEVFGDELVIKLTSILEGVLAQNPNPRINLSPLIQWLSTNKNKFSEGFSAKIHKMVQRTEADQAAMEQYLAAQLQDKDPIEFIEMMIDAATS
ncbi:MAG: hypothetical protein MRY21_08015 [Simkaniaceae bacterium]|nr:hypothetical protein [Simkaniaceae bacterium]